MISLFCFLKTKGGKRRYEIARTVQGQLMRYWRATEKRKEEEKTSKLEDSEKDKVQAAKETTSHAFMSFKLAESH